MLGISSVVGARYHGVDLNPDLEPMYSAMQDFFGLTDRCSFATGRGEEAICKAPPFDVVFSSPPFFYQVYLLMVKLAVTVLSP